MKPHTTQTYQGKQDLGTVDQGETKTACPGGKCSHSSGHIQRLLDVSEMAEILNVPKSWLYERTRRGQTAIPMVKLGKYVRFDPEAVINFFKTQEKSVS